jgi:hypothetical protein
MDELLKRLEIRIKKLLEQQNLLQKANDQLNQGRFLLSREKDTLMDRQKKAIDQIQTLVTRLKAIEKSS